MSNQDVIRGHRGTYAVNRSKTPADRVKAFLYPNRSIADLKSPVFWRDIIVEAICCAYFITLVIWVLVTCNPGHYQPNTTHFGLFAGFLVFALIEAWHPLCNGLLNPAGVWGFWLCGRMSFARFVLSTGAEIAGASAGAMIGFSLTPKEVQDKFRPIMPNVGLGPGKGAVIEGLVTFHLILVALSVTNPKKHSVLAGIAISFCKGSGIIAAGTHTGGLANPIVPYGPALAAQNFKHHFVTYWVGPYIGATISALLFLICTFIGERYKPKPAVDIEDVEKSNNVYDEKEVEKLKQSA